MTVQLGQRFLLPTLVRLAIGKRSSRSGMIGSGHSETRRLWVYIIDPSDTGLQDLGVPLEVPYEPLMEGPVGARFDISGVVNSRMFDFLDWNSDRREAFLKEPLNLDDPSIAASGGLRCTTGDPRFAAQMAYAICQRVYQTFCRALGREPTFGPWQRAALDAGGSVQLRVNTHAFEGDNAYYDPDQGALQFGFFKTGNVDGPLLTNGSIQQYALSHDIVCHELTHALLDGMRAHLMDNTNLDVPAFHEGFSDLIALMHHFTSRTHVRQAIGQTGGIGVKSLLTIGRQLGESDTRTGGSAIRSAMDAMVSEAKADGRLDDAWGRFDRPASDGSGSNKLILVYTDHAPAECHERGAILVVAVIEAFLVTFRKRVRRYRRLAGIITPTDSRGLPAELIDLLTMEANKLAEHFLNMLIRAVDYCPPVDLTFGEYLRALITADRELMPTDEFDYRGSMIRAFRRREIQFESVLDVSEESLLWGRPVHARDPVSGLAFSELRLANDHSEAFDLNEAERWGSVFIRYATRCNQHLAEFGLKPEKAPYGPVVIESINAFSRIDERKTIKRGLIIEVTQQRISRASTVTGGCTVILDSAGYVKYVVRKRVDSINRRRRQAKHCRESDSSGRKLSFLKLHAKKRRH